MKTRIPPGRRGAAGFSLVEVTLALGLVTFSLVGILGVLPIAANSARESFDQNRATAIADTMFAGFRSQPFRAVCYLDTQFNPDGTPMTSPPTPPLDLNASNPGGATCYATFLDAGVIDTAADTFGDERHLCFTSRQFTAAGYSVTMTFHNQPDGMAITPQASAFPNQPPPVPAQASRIELVIAAISHPATQYHFVSTVANLPR